MKSTDSEVSPSNIERIERITVQLLAAYIVEDRIAWTIDRDMGSRDIDLIRFSIRTAVALISELDKLTSKP